MQAGTPALPALTKKKASPRAGQCLREEENGKPFEDLCSAPRRVSLCANACEEPRGLTLALGLVLPSGAPAPSHGARIGRDRYVRRGE